MTNPNLFVPLKQSAREALAAMIDGTGIARSDTPGLIFAEPDAALCGLSGSVLTLPMRSLTRLRPSALRR
jgi:hypothetical protein